MQLQQCCFRERKGSSDMMQGRWGPAYVCEAAVRAVLVLAAPEGGSAAETRARGNAQMGQFGVVYKGAMCDWVSARGWHE